MPSACERELDISITLTGRKEPGCCGFARELLIGIILLSSVTPSGALKTSEPYQLFNILKVFYYNYKARKFPTLRTTSHVGARCHGIRLARARPPERGICGASRLKEGKKSEKYGINKNTK